MKKFILFVLVFFIYSNCFAVGHHPFTSLGFHDGTRSSNYNIDPFQRQATGSLSIADYDITSLDNVDIFGDWGQDTQGWTVFLLYTTDDSAPTKSSNYISMSFEKYNDPERWWYGTIPAQSAGTIVKYVIYGNSSGGNLASANYRMSPNGIETSWTEGDVFWGYGISANSLNTYHTCYFTGNFSNDFRSNENIGTDENSTYYITWDESYLYLGLSTSSHSTNDGSDHFNFAIDKDPNGSNGITSLYSGMQWQANNNGFHKPDYIVQYYNPIGAAYDKIYLAVPSGSNWINTNKFTIYMNYINYSSSGGDVQIRIPWSEIGDKPASTWSCMFWISNYFDTYIWSSFPGV